MHLHFEKSTNAKCDCSIVSLSWMGKVPDNVPEVSAKYICYWKCVAMWYGKLCWIDIYVFLHLK